MPVVARAKKLEPIPKLPSLAVFCSGQGSNLQAIINAIRAKKLLARIVFVLSDQPQAKALKRARRFGIEARTINPKEFSDRAAFEEALIELLDARRVDFVCLAGFMRILSPVFVRHYPNRILNIHPALLPAFPGAHAVRDALSWGAKITGVTVHFVDEHIDHGPIILQEAVEILPKDNEERLFARIHRVEHKLYPEAIRLVLGGRVKIKGRSVAAGRLSAA